MTRCILLSGALLSLGACTVGDSLYDGQAVTQCDEIFDPAQASDCRLDQVESRQIRRSERRNERDDK
ncbi:MAG: hypothetical protein AAFY34_13860 [Pseudomonadota bacterium]